MVVACGLELLEPGSVDFEGQGELRRFENEVLYLKMMRLLSSEVNAELERESTVTDNSNIDLPDCCGSISLLLVSPFFSFGGPS